MTTNESKINKKLLEQIRNDDNRDETIAISCAREILDIFSKYDVSVADSLIMLQALAESIYFYSVYEDVEL